MASAALLTALSSAAFVAAAASLGRLCLALSPVVLGLVLGYSFTKRFTWLCHLGPGHRHRARRRLDRRAR